MRSHLRAAVVGINKNQLSEGYSPQNMVYKTAVVTSLGQALAGSAMAGPILITSTSRLYTAIMLLTCLRASAEPFSLVDIRLLENPTALVLVMPYSSDAMWQASAATQLLVCRLRTGVRDINSAC